MIKYAGIGSRQTPFTHLKKMYEIGGRLGMMRFVLRSGGALGADMAYANGAFQTKGKAEIFLRTSRDLKPEWFKHASMFHPKWKYLDGYAQGLHARNSAIMLGENLDDPVKFVSCWTPNGLIRGGTGQALRIAEKMNIPVFNLALDPDCYMLNQFLEGLRS